MSTSLPFFFSFSRPFLSPSRIHSLVKSVSRSPRFLSSLFSSSSSSSLSLPLTPSLPPPSSLQSSPFPDSSSLSLISPSLSPSSPLIRGTLWLACIFPLQLHFLDFRHRLSSHNHEELVPELMPKEVELISMIPKVKEGGVFVHFEVQKEHFQSAEEVNEEVVRRLKKRPVRARFTTRSVHCHLVKGDPFLEDLLNRYPSTRIKIELKSASESALKEVTTEHLFGQLRAFGTLNDLMLGPFAKDQPRQASLQFRRIHGAIGARNCLHRLAIPIALMSPTWPASQPPSISMVTLYLSYDSLLKTSYLVDFAKNHPRLLVPLLGLLLAGFTLLIFDPLRSFNITNKITQRFNVGVLTHQGILLFLRNSIHSLFHHRIFNVFRHERERIPAVTSWSAREADEKTVLKFLHSVPDRLLFLTGNKGSGKQVLVQKVTEGRANVLVLNFAPFIERNDDDFVKSLSAAIGFSPGFSMLSWASSLLDIFTPGASKASGMGSAQFGSQIQKILEVTADALTRIDSKSNKGYRVPDAVTGPFPVLDNHPGSNGMENKAEFSKNMTQANKIDDQEKQKNEATNVKDSDKERKRESVSFTNAAALAQHNIMQGNNHNDAIPLFLVDGFTVENKDKHSGFFTVFLEWSAAMTSAGLARFIFLTDATLEETISKQLPDIKRQTVSLSDADNESALHFVLSSAVQLDENQREEVAAAVNLLGGRFSDLVSLVRQLESGISPLEAAEEIVNQSCTVIKNLIFNDTKDQKFTRVHLWQTIRALVKTATDNQENKPIADGMPAPKISKNWLNYDDVLFSIFKGDDSALKALIRADLLRAEARVNEPDQLRAGSPVTLEALKRLVRDPHFAPGLDMLVAQATIASEQKKVNEFEDELARLNHLELEYFNARQSRAQNQSDWWKPWTWLSTYFLAAEKEQKLLSQQVASRRLHVLTCLEESVGKVRKSEEMRKKSELHIKASLDASS